MEQLPQACRTDDFTEAADRAIAQYPGANIGTIVGAVMRAMGGKCNPNSVRDYVEAKRCQ